MVEVVVPIACSGCSITRVSSLHSGDQNLLSVAKIPISLASSTSPVSAQMVWPTTHGLQPSDQLSIDQQEGEYGFASEEGEFQHAEDVVGSLSLRQDSG